MNKCINKKLYKTGAKARDVAAWLLLKGYSAYASYYYCKDCQGFHVSTRKNALSRKAG